MGKTFKVMVEGVEKEFSKEEHYIGSKRKDKAYHEKMKNRIKKEFIWCDNTSVREVSPFMSLIEAGAMFSIMVHLDFNTDGFIVYKGRFATMSDLEKLLGKGKRQVANIVKKLEELSLVYRVKQGRSTLIQVNESVHWIGKKVREEIATKVYSKVSKSLIEELDLNELGLLYKIIPYFHCEHMILCKNPGEANPKGLGELSLSELADLVQVDRKTMQRIIPKLVKKKALAKAVTGNRTHYIVNPNLFFRMDGHTETSETARLLFD